MKSVRELLDVLSRKNKSSFDTGNVSLDQLEQ